MFCRHCGKERPSEKSDVCLQCGAFFEKAKTSNQSQKRQSEQHDGVNYGVIFNLLGTIIGIAVCVLSVVMLVTFFLGVFSVFSIYILIMIVTMPILLLALKKADSISVKKFMLVVIISSVMVAVVMAVTTGIVVASSGVFQGFF